LLCWPVDTLGRDPKQRSAFYRLNPCPVTGKTRGSCPGYVIDHRTPLCMGGPDHPSNMQWLPTEDAKKKDRPLVAQCRARGQKTKTPFRE
jgi:hypothetical protein